MISIKKSFVNYYNKNLDEVVWISHDVNTLRKDMNSNFLLQQGLNRRAYRALLLLVWQLVQEKKNSRFKPVKLSFKTDLLSYPTRGGVRLIHSCRHVKVGETSRNLHFLGLRGHWIPLRGLEVLVDWNGWRERVKAILAVSMPWWW